MVAMRRLPELMAQLANERIERDAQACELADFTQARAEEGERSGHRQHQGAFGVATGRGAAAAHDLLDAPHGMGKGLPVIEDLLTMHLHAQPNQILAHGQVAGCAQRKGHGSKRS